MEKATFHDFAGELRPLPHYPPHSMRHTCVLRLVQNGVSLYEVQHLFGHESYRTTQRYAHLAPDACQAVLGGWTRLESRLLIPAVAA